MSKRYIPKKKFKQLVDRYTKILQNKLKSKGVKAYKD